MPTDAKPILIIQSHPIETPGRISEYLQENSIPFTVAHLYQGDKLPHPAELAAIIALGCPASVGDIANESWSAKLFDYLDEVIASKTPYLGICYGAQIMAANRGASVLPNDPREIGVYTVTLNEDGQSDAIFAGFPKSFPAFHWHGEMFEIPLGGALLANSETCKHQAFRFGSAVGIQFHLEADPLKLPIWCREYAEELPEVGKTAEDVLAEYQSAEAETKRLTYLLLSNFLKDV